MTDITTVVYTALIVFGIIGLTEIAFMWYDISHHDKTDDDIQEQWYSEQRKETEDFESKEDMHSMWKRV